MSTTQDPAPTHPTSQQVKPTSTMAVLGLIFGFVFWPLGIVLSVLGLRETRVGGPRAGRGLAIAGLVISLLAALVVVILIVTFAGAASSISSKAASTPRTVTPSSGASASTTEPTDDSTAAPAPPTASASPKAGSAEADVTVNSCEASAIGATGEVTVTNSTSSPKSYLVTVSANDADGNRIGELTAAANAVGPGQSAKAQTVGTLSDGAQIAGCVVANVTRF